MGIRAIMRIMNIEVDFLLFNFISGVFLFEVLQ